MVTVSVVVLALNRADLTLQFLNRFWRLYSARPEVEIVVVDNGSTDSTPGVLVTWQGAMRERLVAIRNLTNQGFGPANNQGAKAATGDVLIFLNNDVDLQGDFIAPICRALEQEPGALVGAQLLDFDTGWNKFGGVLVPYLAGWCVACTRATWDALGGFDERFVPYDYEDVDLSHTARSKGRRLIGLALPVRHISGQTISRMAGERRTITLRNQTLFMNKWGLHAQ